MDELDQIDTWVLPESWCYAKLEDLGYGENAIVDGPFGSNLKVSDYIDDSANGVPVLTTKNLEGNYSKGSVRYISQNKYEELKRSKVQSGDILVAKIGSIGKTGIYPSGMKTAIIPANLLKFTVTPSVDFKYVFAYLNCFNFQQFIRLISTATAQPAFNVTKFRKLPIPLPPLNEQHRIVAKIEELFSELDKGIENLKTAREQLKVYRQALLKHAFEGKLTAQWRAANPDKLEPAAALLARIQTEREQNYRQQLQQWEANGSSKPKAPKPLPPLTAEELAELPELPEGWGWVKVGDVGILGTGVTPLKGRSDFYENGTVPWVTSGALNENYVSNASDYVTRVALKETNLRLYPKHTLLIALYGEGKTRGKCSELLIEATTNQAIAAIVLEGKAAEIRQYMKWFFQKNYGDIRLKSSGGVQPNLNLGIIENTVFPMCSLVEAKYVVEALESKLSETDQLDQTLATSLQQSEALRQSILKKAFSGQLVAQDANDEPANALLARIQTGREQSDGAKRGRKSA